MADNKASNGAGSLPAKFLGSLREALAAAGREEPSRPPVRLEPAPIPIPAPATERSAPGTRREAVPLTAAEAAHKARGGTPNIPPIDHHVEIVAAPTTRVVRGAVASPESGPARTELLRGKSKVKRGEFHQDPVVGWLVVVGGLGLGAFRPVFEGNNTIGRASTQRIPIDFGDEAISSEEQAYIRYDSAERSFLFVPNLAKTNVVSVNEKRPTGAVPLAAMDVITVGRTQLAFIPFCGPEFDWSELPDVKV